MTSCSQSLSACTRTCLCPVFSFLSFTLLSGAVSLFTYSLATGFCSIIIPIPQFLLNVDNIFNTVHKSVQGYKWRRTKTQSRRAKLPVDVTCKSLMPHSYPVLGLSYQPHLMLWSRTSTVLPRYASIQYRVYCRMVPVDLIPRILTRAHRPNALFPSLLVYACVDLLRFPMKRFLLGL